MIIEMKPREPENPDGRLCIDTIRGTLAEVTRLLNIPQAANVEQCAPLLEQAVCAFAGLQSAAGSVTRTEVQAVRTDLSRVQALLMQAARLHSGWAQILGTAVGGYTPSGAPPALECRSRLAVEG